MQISDGIDITAPIDVVWQVFADVQRWPQWTDSVTSVELPGGGPLAVGSQVKISQPRLPDATWTVTDLSPGRSWTWSSAAPGVTTTAVHTLTARGPDVTRVDQSIIQQGLLGALVGRLYAGLTRRYLRMEARGLKAASEARVARS